MTLRDQRQKEFAELFLQENRDGILYLCPRFGKCRVGIRIFEEFRGSNILIAYPDKNIKESWDSEFKEMGYKDKVQFTTHLSLKKYTESNIDLLVIDEIHLLSPNQINEVKKFKNKGVRILGLTGTLSEKTEISLRLSLKLPVLAKYSIQQAIDEGIISDYKITVKTVPLNKNLPIKIGNKIKTEKSHFDAYSYVINKLDESGKDSMFLRLSRVKIIQNSIGKLMETKRLLSSFSDERVLVFCGLIKVAEKLGCPTFHSKAKDKLILENFAKGIGNHLAVIKIGNTGVTYKPLSKVIINYFDSNSENLAQKIFRCMAKEYWNPEKKADIWIVCSDEFVEKEWLKKALEFFDSSKITYQ